MGRFSSKFASPKNVEISRSAEGTPSAADKPSSSAVTAAAPSNPPKCDKKAEKGAEKIKSEKEQTPKSKGGEEKVAAKKPQPKTVDEIRKAVEEAKKKLPPKPKVGALRRQGSSIC